MSEPFIGQISIFGGNFAPSGWAFCNGQLMSIAQNTALFSILGTSYGGDGQTTFALPDLRGRVAVHAGTGPGLPAVNLGQAWGAASTTLLSTQMPAHVHTIAGAPVTGTVTGTIAVYASPGNARSPSGNLLAADSSADQMYQSSSTPTASLQSDSFAGTFAGQVAAGANSGIAGGSQPFSTQPPSLGLNFIIAIEGIYPSRS